MTKPLNDDRLRDEMIFKGGKTNGRQHLLEAIARARVLVADLRDAAERVGQPRAKTLRWRATHLEKTCAWFEERASKATGVTPT